MRKSRVHDEFSAFAEFDEHADDQSTTTFDDDFDEDPDDVATDPTGFPALGEGARRSACGLGRWR